MKLISMINIIIATVVLASCSDDKNNSENAVANPAAENKTAAASESQQGGIVGEWDQQYTCFDKNGNLKLEPEEKKASGTRLGFNWFKFNADGTCQRDKDLRFEGTYKVEGKNENRKLLIEGGDNLRYSIADLTQTELILGADGAFIVFKRIK